MNLWRVAVRSFVWYARSDAVVSLGVAAATAVLVGALMIGDSMRGTLRWLAEDRLGQIDEVLVADGFFRQQLIDDWAQQPEVSSQIRIASPAILFPSANVETSAGASLSRATGVSVLGVRPSFWQLDREGSQDPPAPWQGEMAAVNEPLADALGLTQEMVDAGRARVTIRLPRPSLIPADSAIAKKRGLVINLVDVPVRRIVKARGLGRFSMQNSQTDPMNVYLPIDLVDQELRRGPLSHRSGGALCNAAFLARSSEAVDGAMTITSLESLRPTLDDWGLLLKHARLEYGAGAEQRVIYDYWSLSSDRLMLPKEVVDSVLRSISGSRPLLTYLANDIAKVDEPEGIPFSMVTALELDRSIGLVDLQGDPIERLESGQIVLNQWAAEDLGARTGDRIRIRYYEPETTHGREVEREATFELVAIARLTPPITPFRVRRGRIDPPEYDQPPTAANDPDFTPFVPGVTDAESIDRWELPFETADRIRPEDDQYWSEYRTTPKGFIALEEGRRLWTSRFGDTTSIRIPASDWTGDSLATAVADAIRKDHGALGFRVIPVRRNALLASQGSTPFDVLFLALSMFVIAAALILVYLLFRLTLARRSEQSGLLLATGFDGSRLVRLWLLEMSLVALVGGVLGVAIGWAYARLMIYGLTTWWVGAIGRPILQLVVQPRSLLIGGSAGAVTGLLTLYFGARRASRVSARELLAGRMEPSVRVTSGGHGRVGWIAIGVCGVSAIGSLVAATRLGGEPQAGAFMAAGFFVLTALLVAWHRWWRSRERKPSGLTLTRLALVNGRRSPLRSTLTLGLVAVAAFLIVAVSAFRLAPDEFGTGGFDYVARSDQAIFDDLNDPRVRLELLGPQAGRWPDAQIHMFRVKPGENASCTNLYQASQPQVLGIEDRFIRAFDDPDRTPFLWAATEAETDAERANPWHMLDRRFDDGAIPVVIDKNTANYSLKIFATGGDYVVKYDSGQTVTFRVVGFLSNTVLQGSLLISEQHFVKAFPEIAGYRYFLIRSGEVRDDGHVSSDQPGAAVTSGQVSEVDLAVLLETYLADEGFDARPAVQVLAELMQVQNAYISTFQTLGGLGLLLGTFGLAAVQFRNVVERQGELGLMQAVGFTRSRLARLVLLENGWLLLAGLGTGLFAALFTTLPLASITRVGVPWRELAGLFAIIFAVGWVTAWIAARLIARQKLVDSLRR